jgi:hypothetical protein
MTMPKLHGSADSEIKPTERRSEEEECKKHLNSRL